MKRISKQVGATIFAAIIMSSTQTTYASLVDITINDGDGGAFYGSDPRGIGESGETSLGTIASHEWDLIGFGFSENTLVVVSGFNPLTTRDGFGIGYVLVSVEGDLINPTRTGSNGYFTYPNPGFKWCLEVTGTIGSALTYNLVSMTEESTVETGFYTQNANSDPWRIIRSNADTVLESGFSTVTVMTDAEVQNMGMNIGDNGGSNYVFAFDISQILSRAGGEVLDFQLTQQCGNDLLKGRLSEKSFVPEPSSTIMWGLGLLGCLVVRRR